MKNSIVAGKLVNRKRIGFSEAPKFGAIGVKRIDGIIMIKNDINGVELYTDVEEVKKDLLKSGKDVAIILLDYLKAHQVPIQMEERYYEVCKILKDERGYKSSI
jgi:hypothetical protein